MGYVAHFKQILRFPKKYHTEAAASLNTYFKTNFDTLLELIINEGLLIMYSCDVQITAQETIICEMWYDRKYSQDHEELLKCIAPYVEDTEITIYGEDNNSWQLAIKNGKFKRRHIEYITDDD